MDAKEKAIEVERELQLMPVTGAHVYMVTLDRRDRHQREGQVFLVPRNMAARLRVEGTHTYAAPQQISQYETEHKSRHQEITRQLREEQQKFQIMLTPELIAMTQQRQGKGEK